MSVLDGVRTGRVVGQGRRRLPRRRWRCSRRRSREPRGPGRRRGWTSVDALLVTDRANLRYLTGFTGSTGYAVVGAAGPPLRHRLPLRRAREARGARLRPRAGPDRAVGRAAPRAADGRGPARVRRRAPIGARARAAAGDAARERVELVASRRAWSRRSARSRSRGRSRRSRAAAALVDEIYGWSTSAGWSGAPSARWRSRSSTRCAVRGASGPSFPSIVASAEHGALPHAEPRDVAIAPRHAGHARHRRAAGRLLLGLHAHLGHRRRSRTSWPRPTRSSCARSWRRWPRSGPGRGAARSTPSRAT